MDENTVAGFISTYGYDAKGFRVTVSLNILEGEDDSQLYRELHGLIEAGYLTVNPPGVEPGENSEVVTHIVRRAKPKDNTPIIGFYLEHPDMVHKWFQVYLNFDDAGKATAQQLTDAAGLDSIKALPLWTGDGFPNKTTMTGDRAQYFIRLPYPIRVIRKDTGKRGTFDDKEYTIWELVRIERADNSAAEPVPTDVPETSWNVSDLIKVIKDWPHFDGQSVHAANAIQKLVANNDIEQDMLHDEALDVLTHHYDQGDGMDAPDDADELMATEHPGDDIPF